MKKSIILIIYKCPDKNIAHYICLIKIPVSTCYCSFVLYSSVDPTKDLRVLAVLHSELPPGPQASLNGLYTFPQIREQSSL